MSKALWRPSAAAILVAAALSAPTGASTQEANYCTRAPTSFTCGAETCFTACMTPDEWSLCATKTWYADSYDHKSTAPRGATAKNRVRFYERCGTVCRPMGSPRMAYRTQGGTLPDGTVVAPRWVVFPFSPARKK